MTSVIIEGCLYCYVDNEADLVAIAQTVAPDFTDFWTDLQEEHRKDSIKFTGRGIYEIDYFVGNPCWHGLYVRPVEGKEVKRMADGLQAVLERSLIL